MQFHIKTLRRQLFLSWHWLLPMCIITFISCKKYNTPLPEYNKLYGGLKDDFGYSIAATQDGGYILAGVTTSYSVGSAASHGQADVLIIKADANGNISWQKTFGGAGNDSAFSIISSSDGNFVIAGSTTSGDSTGKPDGDVTVNHGAEDFWVLKIDASGKLLWQKTFGKSDREIAKSIVETRAGEYVIAGFQTGPTLPSDAVNSVIKITGIGNIAWGPLNHGDSNQDRIWYSVAASKNGDILAAGVSGLTSTNSESGDIDFNRFTEAGVDLTTYGQVALGGLHRDFVNSVVATSDSGYVMAGTTNSNGGYFVNPDPKKQNVNFDFCLYKIDKITSAVWLKTYGGSGVDIANAVIQTADGGFLVAGETSSTDSKDGDVINSRGGIDAWVIKVDSRGNKLWQQTIGGSGTDIAYGIVEIPRRGYVVLGTTNSNDGDFSSNHGGYDIFTVTIKRDY